MYYYSYLASIILSRLFIDGLQNSSFFIASLFIGVIIAFAIGLSLIKTTSEFQQVSSKVFYLKTFILFFVTVFACHYKPESFFYWDEWDLIDNFRLYGSKAILSSHGVHFIPVFMLTYLLEIKLFASNYNFYQYFSILIHSINAFLLFLIIKEYMCDKSSAFLGGLFFCISSLVTTSISLVILQSLELSLIFMQLSLLLALKYIKEGKGLHLVLVLFFSLLSAFSFSGSVVSSLVVFTMGFFFFLIKFTENKTFFSIFINRESLIEYRSPVKRVLYLFYLQFAYIIILVGTYVATYYLSQKSVFNHSDTGHSIPVLLANLGQVAKFFSLGSQYGTFWRNTGLITTIKFDTNAVSSLGYLNYSGYSGLLFLVFLGLSINLLCLFYFYKNKNREGMLVWFLAQTIITAYYIIPAVGRWTLSPVQSLEPRYQLIPLIAICFLISSILKTLNLETLFKRNPSLWLSFLIGIFIFNHMRLSNFYIMRPEYENVMEELRNNTSRIISNASKGLDDSTLGLGVNMDLYPPRFTPRSIYENYKYLNR